MLRFFFISLNRWININYFMGNISNKISISHEITGWGIHKNKCKTFKGVNRCDIRKEILNKYSFRKNSPILKPCYKISSHEKTENISYSKPAWKEH